ncbi:MAG: hypothetical protein M1376_04930 [Planctomycetes bacterium]|nr:hypothetical protein [Planctomycetota bacterium]
MNEENDATLDFQSRLLLLKLDVEHMAAAMQAESEKAQRSLTIYPRARALLNRLLGSAAGHQAKAANLGRRLNGCLDRLKSLEAEAETVVAHLAERDPEQAKILRRDLRQIREQIRRWSVGSDGLG